MLKRFFCLSPNRFAFSRRPVDRDFFPGRRIKVSCRGINGTRETIEVGGEGEMEYQLGRIREDPEWRLERFISRTRK